MKKYVWFFYFKFDRRVNQPQQLRRKSVTRCAEKEFLQNLCLYLYNV